MSFANSYKFLLQVWLLKSSFISHLCTLYFLNRDVGPVNLTF